MRIERLALASRDATALAEFYRTAFDASLRNGGVTLGGEIIEIDAATACGANDYRANETGFQHFALVVADIDAAYRRLCEIEGWRPISLEGPERLPQASGGAAAFKFRDPHGHPLELLEFPASGVPAMWRGRIDADPHRLFLGVDHTALTVSDAQASIAFYTSLGFVCSHRQINSGAEQRRLDGLADATNVIVEIVSLSPPDGTRPGIELLAYRSPATIKRRVWEASKSATTMVFPGSAARTMHDPDGHRLEIRPSLLTSR